MKKVIVGLLIGVLCLGSKVVLQAEGSTDETDLLNGSGIVTEENAVPIDKDKIEGMVDAEMGNGLPSSDMNKGRSAYGTTWDMTPGAKKFYDGNGAQMYGVGAKMVIDVSQWQSVINWDQVKAAGVDGAILRMSYGFGNGYDTQFLRNVSECNRLGIPYGVYIYSYAYDANFAYAEAADVVNLLSQANVNLSYPIYYDVEGFSPFNYEGVTRYHPTSPGQYETIIGTFIDYMNNHGYGGKVHVYSYRSYLQNELNSPAILRYVSWIAAYTRALGYTNQHYGGTQGWQYSSTESVPGIAGNVDVSCFSDVMFGKAPTPNPPDPVVSEAVPDSITNKLAEQSIKFNSGYLTGVAMNGDISTFKNTLSSVGEVSLYDVNGTKITSGKLATGQVISVKTNARNTTSEYKMAVVVRGDVNGDGNVTSMDYVKIKNHILGLNPLSGPYLKGADASGEGTITSMDYVMTKNQMLGTYTIKQ